jgi:hypothetical protein
MLVCLDDDLIFTLSAEEHKARVELVLTRLLAERLFAKLSNYRFHMPPVKFLGHLVGQNGLSMEKKKVKCVLQWPRSKTWLEDLAKFIFKSRNVKGKHNLVSDALSRMYDRTLMKLYDWDDGIISSKTAPEHGNVELMC